MASQSVSDGRKASAETRASLEALIAVIPDGALVVDATGHILFSNAFSEKIFGYRPGELNGHEIGLLMPALAGATPADVPHDPTTPLAGIGRRKGGATFPVEVTGGEVVWGGQTLSLRIIRDVTARDSNESELAAARDTAIAASIAKTHFLAQMSHELRTPLNAILGFSEMIGHQLYGPVSPQRYADYIGHIVTSGRHLLSLIDDLLDISRIEAGKFELHEDTIDLAEVIQFAVLSVETLRRPKGIVITTSLPPVRPILKADPRLCRQMAANLLSNAVKFTPANGQVGVTVADRSDGGLDFAVSDTGIGIDPELLPQLGRFFVQVKDSYTVNTEGTGIGLALTKKFAELHGGRFRIESEPNRGTRVTIGFPPSRCSRS